MPQFSDKLDLKERAEEDIYFARRDRELIAALHQKESGKIPARDRGNRFGNTEGEEYGRTQVSGQGEGEPAHYHEVIRKILSMIHPPGRA